MLSIITATFNSKNTILNLINSLNKVNSKIFEWVVIDGQSSDKTVSIVKSNYNGKLLIKSEPDKGIYHAINKGILLSNYDYYLVIGSDDFFYDGAIEHLVTLIRHKSPDFITGKVTDMTKKIYLPMNINRYRYGQRTYISNHSVGLVIKKELHSYLDLYSLDYKLCSDQLFILNAIDSGAKIIYTDYLLGVYSGEGVSATNKLRWMIEFYIISIKTNPKSFLYATFLFIYRFIKGLKK